MSGSANRNKVPGPPKKEKLGPYQSPFIAKAQARALERAKVVNKHLPRSGFIKNEWDQTPKSPGGLFDPSVKKSDIFRLEPRNVRKSGGRSSRASDLDISQISRNSHNDERDRRPAPTSGLTMKTQEISPRRKPPIPPAAYKPRSISPQESRPENESRHHRERERDTSPPPPPPPRTPPTAPSSSEKPIPRTTLKLHEKGFFQPELSAIDEKLKDQAQEHYGNMIRDKLKSLLYQRMGVNGEEVSIPATQRRPARRIVRTTSSYHQDTQQAFMRDMMGSMAQMMQAVGNIVAGVGEHRKYNARERLFRPARRRDGSRVVEGNPYVPPETLVREYGPSLSSPHPTPSSSNMVWSVAQHVHAATQQKPELPRSRSGVLDMVLAKIQAIEQSEREISYYLQQRQPIALDAEEQMAASRNKVEMEENKRREEVKKELLEKDKLKMEGILKDLLAEKQRKQSNSEEQAVESKAIKYPKLKMDLVDRDEMLRYMEELQGARKLREIVYERGGTSLSDATSLITDTMMQQMLRSVTKELDKVFEDYSQKFLTTI